MIKKKLLYLCFLCLSLLNEPVSAQSYLQDTSVGVKQHLVVAYLLDINSARKNGIAESYNGAIKTIFINDGMARSRMVSLMRVQSIFYTSSQEGKADIVTIVKESGKDSYKKNVTGLQWQQLHKKYEGAVYEFLSDSLELLGYHCKKAIVTLQDGKKIIAYYTSAITNTIFGKVEPAFAGIPGLVLKYEYRNKDAIFTYTATDISFAVTGPEVYKIP